MRRALLDRLLAERAAKHPVALVTEIPGGAQALVTEDRLEGELALDDTGLAEVRAMLRRDQSDIFEHEGRRLFVQCNNPPPRLLDFGITNEQAWDVGLACGGKLQIWLEAIE